MLVCEHGGRAFPAKLGQLGLDDEQACRHFAWDIGALDLARGLSCALDAPLIHQQYSRLICDGNRKPSVDSFISEQGEEISIPGNIDISKDQRAARINEVWRPFHDRVSHLLDQREQLSLPTILISIHSFTPTFFAEQRFIEAGILCDRERRFANPLYQQLAKVKGERVAINEPYDMNRETDYTIPIHGEDRGLLCAEIEVRNDLISDPAGITLWAEILEQAISHTIGSVWQTTKKQIQK